MAQRIVFISPEEYQRLFKAAKDKETKLILMLGFGAGLRISEICGLKEKVTVCCKEKVIISQELMNGKKYKKYTCSKCGKNLNIKELRYSGKEWHIPPLTADKIDLARHQIKIDYAKGNKNRITISPPSLTEDYLKHLPIKTTIRNIQYRFSSLAFKELGKKMSVHTLRHGFANLQANILKIPLPMIQGFMGHSRLDTTGIYTKANPEDSIKQVWKAMGGE